MIERTFQIFSTQDRAYFEHCFSFVSASLSLFSNSLSFAVPLSLSPCLVYLLSQPRKSRDYQGDNPSGRGLLLPTSTESLLFFPSFFLPSCLISFLMQGVRV